MHILIDGILILIMVLVVYNAAKKGFIVALFNMISVWAALAIALVFCSPLGTYINTNFVSSYVDEYTSDILAKVTAQSEETLEDGILSTLPEGFTNAAEFLGVDIENMIGGLSGEINEGAEETAKTLSIAISNIIAFVIIFLVAIIALKLACLILDKLATAPGLKQINVFLGALLGLSEAFVLGILLSNIAEALIDAIGLMNEDMMLADIMDKTVVAKFLLSVFSW